MTEPEVIRLSIPNPFFEGRNQVYVITSEPLTMIDSGIATQRAFDALIEGLREHGLSPGDVQRVVLTHKHIDHIGNAWRIQQESGAELLIHESESHSITKVDPEGERFKQLVDDRMRDWRVPEADPQSESSSATWRWEIESAEATSLCDLQCLPQGRGRLEVLHTPGHTMGSICLRYGRYLFSGDHVLLEISPNVGGGDMRNRGMLRHYLASLERIAELAEEDDLEVLPGHGDPFSGARRRCAELVEHHHQRLAQVQEILQRHGSQTVYEMACRLFGEMRDFHLVLGCAEAAAHLEYLAHEGRVVASDRGYCLADAS